MSAARVTSWRSLHVYCGDSYARVLVECVGPLLESGLRRGVIDRFFFIHYWIGGPHIRIRFRGPRSLSFEIYLRGRIREYLQNRPVCTYPAWIHDMSFDAVAAFRHEYPEEDTQRWIGDDGQMKLQALNLVVPQPYVPEFDRYGRQGVGVAEETFCTSSVVALEIMSRGPYSRGRLLGIAAQLLVAALAAGGVPMSKCYRMCTLYTERWRDLLGDGFDALVSPVPLAADAESRHMRQIFAMVSAGQLTGVDTIDQWASTVKQAIDGYTDLGFEFSNMPFFSLVHMMFNRLGLSVPDEIVVIGRVSKSLNE